MFQLVLKHMLFYFKMLVNIAYLKLGISKCIKSCIKEVSFIFNINCYC